MPLLPVRGQARESSTRESETSRVLARTESEVGRPSRTQVRNRRKKFLDTHPEYFSPTLELADPLLYDRLVRRFQTAAERETEGREKGYSGVLEADLLRAEAKVEALAHPDPNVPLSYRRGPGGEILAEDPDEIPKSKEEGIQIWRKTMELRFLQGDDDDFDYKSVDDNDEFDDKELETRDAQDEYFDAENPGWVAAEDADGDITPQLLTGETGIQDF